MSHRDMKSGGSFAEAVRAEALKSRHAAPARLAVALALQIGRAHV